MKGYVKCENCDKEFVIDEVDYTYNEENNLTHLCENCKEF